MIPTQELQKYFDNSPNGAWEREIYYHGSESFQKIMNFVSTASQLQLDSILHLLTEDRNTQVGFMGAEIKKEIAQ